MQEHLLNRLSQHEIAPPPEVWNSISRRLDEEFVSSDVALSDKMLNANIVPPPGSWQSVAAALGSESIQTPKAPVVPLVYRRIAIAAAIVAVVGVIAAYFLNNNGPALKRTDAVASSAPLIDRERAARPAPLTQLPSRDSASPRRTLIASAVTKRPAPQRRATVTERFQNIFRPVQTVPAIEPVEVEAPPIRDANGNIVMDYSVIKKPNESYIKVTSPNGLQTKISSKFINCLSYLYNNSSSSYTNNEEREWQETFSEWRNKLLGESGFVPTASNFFDIFELKELIEE